MIPKSIPIEFSVFGKSSADVSTKKLRKYLLVLSLIIVTDDGRLGSGLDQCTLSLPTNDYNLEYLMRRFVSIVIYY